MIRKAEKTKGISSDHMLLLWSCKRVNRKVATEAFEAVDMKDLIPKVDHFAALLRASKIVCNVFGIRCKLKFFALPGGADTVGFLQSLHQRNRLRVRDLRSQPFQ